MDSNENKELDLKVTNNLDDVATVDLAWQLSNYDDDELKNCSRDKRPRLF